MDLNDAIHAAAVRERRPPGGRFAGLDVRAIGPHDPGFPTLLRDGLLPPAPAALFVRGALEPLPPPERCVALIGARRCTDEGRQIARGLAAGLARAGVVVVSGLALGIDAAAHEGALDADGLTLAVLASSVDEPTPRTNARLGQEIANGGGWLVSERPPKASVLRDEFPRRNRLVVALCGAIVVVEAGLPSGTLTTVDRALRVGRPVGAVPGSILAPASRGANELLRCGATPILGVDDILALLGRVGPAAKTTPDPEDRALLDGLPGVSGPVDAWLAASGLEPEPARAALLRLLARGALRRLGSGHVARCLQA